MNTDENVLEYADRQICTGIVQRFVGDRQVKVLVSNEDRALDGMVVRTAGLDLTQYRRNPIVLANHDTSAPIGTMPDIRVSGTTVTGTVQFAPAGVDPEADRVCALVKSDILRGVSIGFSSIETKPINGVVHVTRSILHEVSIVSLPACHNCMVTERAASDLAIEARAMRARAVKAKHLGERVRRELAAAIRADFLRNHAS